MFRLQRRAVAFTRIRDGGAEVPDVRSEHRPPNPFYLSGGLPRHRRQNVTSLADHTEPGLSSTLLPAPQSETDGKQQVVSSLVSRLSLPVAAHERTLILGGKPT
jgi:hypothetical protein